MSNFEDRHTFSDPRLASDTDPSFADMPAWHVDVYRKGVSEPVDTLLIDDSTLPPRKNKKGRVIWRLPDEPDERLPNFGTDERRRLVELFKEQKKERKKSAKKSQLAGAMSVAAAYATSEDSLTRTPSSSFAAASCGASSPPSPKEDDWLAPAVLAKQKSGGRRKGSKKSADSIGRDDSPTMTVSSKSKSKAARDRRKGNSDSGRAAAAADRPAPSPPGFRPSPPTSGNSHLEVQRLAEDMSDAFLADVPAAAVPLAQQQQAIDRLPPSLPDVRNPLPPPPPPAPSDAEYIIVPETDRPETDRPDPSSALPPSQAQQPSNPSMAVAAAKAFVDLYYPLLAHGLCDNLARHYTPRAQKSVSVGGAHAVVTGRDDIALQIAGLAGSAFAVRGVVAQDAHDGRGAHILVTGLVQTPAAGGSGGVSPGDVATPFAHSVSLVPATAQGFNETVGGIGAVAPYAFQIHNDALSLLGGDMLPAPAAPAPVSLGVGHHGGAAAHQSAQTPQHSSDRKSVV